MSEEHAVSVCLISHSAMSKEAAGLGEPGP